jgi:hypothetical protein
VILPFSAARDTLKVLARRGHMRVTPWLALRAIL